MRYTPIIPQRLNPIKDFNKVLSVGEYFTAKNLPPARDSAKNLLRWLAGEVLEVNKWGDPNLSGMPRVYRSVMVEKWTQYDTKDVSGITQEYTGTVNPYGADLNALWANVLKQEDRAELKKTEGWYWFMMLRSIKAPQLKKLKKVKDQLGNPTPKQVVAKDSTLSTLILNLYDKDNMQWYDVAFGEFRASFYRMTDISPNPSAYQDMVKNSPLKPMFEWLAKNHGGSWPRKVINIVKEMTDISKINKLEAWKKQVNTWGLKSSYTRLFDVQQQRTLAPEEASLARKGYIALARKQQPIQEEVERTLDRPLTDAEKEMLGNMSRHSNVSRAICALLHNKKAMETYLNLCEREYEDY